MQLLPRLSSPVTRRSVAGSRSHPGDNGASRRNRSALLRLAGCLLLVLSILASLAVPGNPSAGAGANADLQDAPFAESAQVTSSERIIRPDADARVEEAVQNTNFGTAASLTADGGTDPDVESYLKFTIPPTASDMLGAKLRLFVYNGTVDGPAIYATDSSWTETGITWSNRPARASGPVDDKGAIPVNSWVEFDVTSLISGAGTYSFVLATTSADAASARSRENFTDRPELVLTVDGPPPTATPTRTPVSVDTGVILAAGDIASCPSSGDEATGALIASEPGIVLALGDLAYDAGTSTEFANCYDPSWGGFRDRTYPVPGNHEYNTKGATGYYGYFGDRAGDPTKGYYSYDAGAWHIVALNSNCSAIGGSTIGGCGVGSAQEQWLRADLAAHPSSCILAYWHHPLYSSGLHRSDPRMRAMWQALYDYGAEIVLSGHDHIYERFAPQDALGNVDAAGGIREFVVGTGGKDHYTIGAPEANSQIRDNTSHGVLRLVLSPTGYEWTFLPIDGETFTDAGSGSCSGGSPSTPTGTPTETATESATSTETPTGTVEPTETPTSTATPTEATTSTATPDGAPTHTATSSSTPSPTETATPSATVSHTPTSTATSPPVTMTFAPVADARVVSSDPDTNFGSEATLSVDGSPLTESYLRFDVAGLDGPALRATLRLWMVDATATGPPIATCGGANWDESELTWANKPAISESPDDEAAVSIGAWTEYDVTPFITGNGNICLALASQTSDGVDFSSREGAFPPQLVVSGAAPPMATATNTSAPATATFTATATLPATATATDTATATATATATPTATSTATGTPTSTPLPTSTPTATSTPTSTPTPTTPPTSTSTPTNTPTLVPGTLFSDGFESGNLTKWVAGSGLVVQQSIVAKGSWAARGTSTGTTAAWARGNLTTSPTEVYARIRFRVVSRGANELTLVRLETGSNTPIVSIIINPNGKLAMRRTGSTAVLNSNTTVNTGAWHELRVRLKVSGTTGLTEVWLNTTRLTLLSKAANLGTAAVARVEIGESASNRRFDVVFDDVLVSSSAIAASAVTSAASTSARSADVPTVTETATAAPTATIVPTPTETAIPLTPTAAETPQPSATESDETEGTPIDQPAAPADEPTLIPTEPAPTATESADASTVTPYPIAQTARSKTTVSSSLAIDGDALTVWQTADGVDPGRVAVLRLDLGEPLPVDHLRILPGPNGLAGTVTIETSDDGKTWAYFGIPEQGAEWLTVTRDPALTEPVTTRYVRIVCVNDGAQVLLGGVAEVEVYPPAVNPG